MNSAVTGATVFHSRPGFVYNYFRQQRILPVSFLLLSLL